MLIILKVGKEGWLLSPSRSGAPINISRERKRGALGTQYPRSHGTLSSINGENNSPRASRMVKQRLNIVNELVCSPLVGEFNGGYKTSFV